MTLLLGDPAFLAVAGAVAASGYDSDAQAYITAVESVDGQALETGVRDAINEFFVGCKADGIWSGIKASCILAGARTREGSLVPLVGTAPTALGTVGGWSYNRKTGTQGNGTDNYLNSGRANNADPQNNSHISVRVSTAGTTGYYIASNVQTGGHSAISVEPANTRELWSSRSTALARFTSGTHAATGFKGLARSASTNFVVRTNQTPTTFTDTSTTAEPGTIYVFARNSNTGAPGVFSNARLQFYSIGENLNLALLDSRVTALMNAFAAAIP